MAYSDRSPLQRVIRLGGALIFKIHCDHLGEEGTEPRIELRSLVLASDASQQSPAGGYIA